MLKDNISVYQRKEYSEDENIVLKKIKGVFSFDLFLSLIGVLFSYAEIISGLLPFGVIYFTIFFYYELRYKSNKKRFWLIYIGVSIGYLIDFNYYKISYLIIISLLLLLKEKLKGLKHLRYALRITIIFLAVQSIFFTFNPNLLNLLNIALEASIVILAIILILNLVPDISIFLESKKKSITYGVLFIIFFSGLLISGFSNQLVLENFYSISLARLIIDYIILVSIFTIGIKTALIFALLFGFAAGLIKGSLNFLPGNYAFSALLTSLFLKQGRLWVLSVYTLSKLFFLSFLEGEILFLALLIESFIASILFLLTPKKIINSFKTLATPNNRCEELERFKLQNFVTHRINRFSKIFDELYQSFSSVSKNQDSKESMGTFLDVIVSKSCQYCSLYQSCWKESFYTTYNSVFNLLSLAEEQGKISEKDLVRVMDINCSKQQKMTNTINQFIEMYEVNSYWKKRLSDNEDILLQQLSGVANIINELAQELDIKVKAEERLEKKIYSVLKYNDIAVEKILATNYDQQSLEFTVRKKRCDSEKICEDQVLEVFKENFDYDFDLIWNECGYELDNSYCICQYKRANEYQLETGVASFSSADRISGDNHSFFKHRDDKFSIILSDGMGVGSKAYQESVSTVKLMEKMIKANVNYQLTLETINKILSLRTEEDKFATIDFLTIEQTSGQADFIKVGSAASFIKRDKEVEVINSATLPIGILSQVEYEKHSIKLRAGDLIIMITDGILDSQQDMIIKEAWINKILENNLLDHPQTLAEYILEKAKIDNEIEDDMTVLVIKVNKC